MTEIILTEEQRMIREVVGSFVRKEIEPIASRIDEEEKFPEDIFRKMGEFGLLGVLLPKEHGGADAGAVAATVVIEVISKVQASVGLSFGAHAVLCANNLRENCNQRQKDKYLPGLASGKSIGAMALTEPEAGSDAMGIKTHAVKKGNEYILNGAKTFITNGPVADVILVYAKSLNIKDQKIPLSAFIVEKGYPGFSVGKKITKMGMRASPTSELIFEDCRVPAENLIGEEGKALNMIWRGLNVERITLSGICLGILHSCLDTATRYSMERRQFGKPIADFQMIQQMIADMSTSISAAHLLVYYAAQEADKGRRVNREAAEAKLFASEAATRAALDTIQILGGYGYTREFPVERWMRDAKLMEIGAGTSQIMRYIIAKEILKQ
ncbi:MAG: acyl-CoA dehydrogenase family protein [Proteobacteria bacterium]|nr:acyl-CoA dehydrogenase family protein [Pseudomonadota bacterium]